MSTARKFDRKGFLDRLKNVEELIEEIEVVLLGLEQKAEVQDGLILLQSVKDRLYNLKNLSYGIS